MKRCILFSVVLLLAGCQNTALYKPGITISEAVQEYDVLMRSVLTTGPIIRSGRDEVRVFMATLESSGFQEVPVGELPPGTVIVIHRGDRIAGLPDKK